MGSVGIPALLGNRLSPLELLYFKQPSDIARHDQTKIFDLKLQVPLRVLDDLLDLPVHRVERMVGTVENSVGTGPRDRLTEERKPPHARAVHMNVLTLLRDLDHVSYPFD